MIPYDELVARLQSWRARQGLPAAAPNTPALEASAPHAPADVFSGEHLEVIDEVHDAGEEAFSLSSIDSDEKTPIGGLP